MAQEPLEPSTIPTSEHSLTAAVLGLDVGGTSTRAAILNRAGSIAALISGPGANVHSSAGLARTTLADLVTRAVLEAQSTLGQSMHVSACVAGVAGAGLAARERVSEMLGEALSAAGLSPSVVDLVPDPVVAFAAGSPSPDGIVLLAGTGAVAFRIEGFRQSARSDGLGWILGDVGGGIWLALEGFRAAANDLDGRGAATALTAEVLAVTVGADPTTGDPRQDIVRHIHGSSPSELGGFAPTVTRLAAEGDAVARQIVERAVEGLLHTGEAVGMSTSATIVLAGSILTRSGPIRDGVLAGILTQTHDAVQPVVGALRLAAHHTGWPLPPIRSLADAVEAAVSRDS
ncbi:MAG: N-acetylglucosamine kinase [Arachnia sp.]